jgi:hypothetical protein
MNRRRFLALIPALALPHELKAAAAAFAKSCEEKPEIKRKQIIDVCYTGQCAFVTYADGSYHLFPPNEDPT